MASFGLLLGVLAGCASPEPAEPEAAVVEPAPERPLEVDRALFQALQDFVYATYEARLALERRAEDGGELPDPALLEERVALARDALRAVCEERGAPADLPQRELLGRIRQGVTARRRFAFVSSHDADSFALVRLRERDEPRRMTLFGEPFAYRLTISDETLVEDYPAWRGARLNAPVRRQTATYREDGTLCVDLAIARWVGERQFLPAVEALRAEAASARREEAFRERAAGELVELLVLTKQALRWRSLESLWSRIQFRPSDEQVRRFAEDYAERAELRAAAELRELRVLRGPAPESPELSPAERTRLFELGTLSAVIHGEPLGQLADVFSLAALSLAGPRHAPHFRAARALVVDFVSRLREGEPGPEADALAFARLAAAEPQLLRELARELYAARTN